MQPFTLEGKTILVTGASSGIGRAVAIACSKAGAKCVLVDKNEEGAKETLSLCSGKGHVIEVVDLTDYEALKALVERVPAVDGLVQSAGIIDNWTPLKFLSPKFVDQVLDINLKVPILLLALMEKRKKLNKGGSVVMMSSIASFCASIAHSLYAASKGGLEAFVRGAALELASRRIRVNSLSTAMVNTPLIAFSELSEEQKRQDEAKYPLKRYGEPEEVANATLYLLSDASSWVTGQQIVMDGGFTIGR